MNEHKKYNTIKGNISESVAVGYLKNCGYKNIITNFKCNIGEIDIIAREDNVLVFVEVKYRKNNIFGMPREAVNYQKQQKIRRVALSYMKKHGLMDSPCRFDVLEILGDQITLIKDCF